MISDDMLNLPNFLLINGDLPPPPTPVEVPPNAVDRPVTGEQPRCLAVTLPAAFAANGDDAGDLIRKILAFQL